jgi:hypothetical protein
MAYNCKDAKKDIDFFFSYEGGSEEELRAASTRFTLHVFEQEEPGGETTIKCKKCYQYLDRKRKKSDL